MGNSFDEWLEALSANREFFQRFTRAVEAERDQAVKDLSSLAVAALYDPVKTSQACGQHGVCRVWDDILARAYAISRRNG